MADGFPLTGFEPSRVAKKLRCRAEGCILLKKEKKNYFRIALRTSCISRIALAQTCCFNKILASEVHRGKQGD